MDEPRECPMCHQVGSHGTVPRPDDRSRRVRCPNEAIEQGRFQTVISRPTRRSPS